MSTYTEIPFERAEALWELGVNVWYEEDDGAWRLVLPKDEMCVDFWDEEQPSPFRYRVQTE